MTRLQSLRHWNKLKKRVANAPHGERLKRLAELRQFTTLMLMGKA
jgi:hypothetical protein